jgi:hypothetical protein
LGLTHYFICALLHPHELLIHLSALFLGGSIRTRLGV